MFWGAFGMNGTTELAEVPTRMNSEGYQEILEETLLPSAQRISKRGWIFQQDNASIHASNSTAAFFEKKRMRVLDWPAKSPDLNPMENLWGMVARNFYVHGRQYPNKETLIKALTAAWNAIPCEIIHNLIRSMKTRIYNTILKKGFFTK
jgi:hypothetical protein